jgi:hypothetical protein
VTGTITCVLCDKPLTGGTDTFGDAHNPMCQSDWLAMIDEGRFAEREERNNLRRYLAELEDENRGLESEVRDEENEDERFSLRELISRNQRRIAEVKMRLGE